MNKLYIKLFMVFLFLQVGCTSQKEIVHLPKEEDIVTWKQNDYLIVKAKLGARR